MRFKSLSQTWRRRPFLGLVVAASIMTFGTESVAQQHSDQDLTAEPPTGEMPADEASTAPAPGPAAAVIPGPDAILRQLEARREMGLIADADVVAELLLHPDDHGAVDGFGAYLLPSEWARVRELWMVSQQFHVVDDFVRQRRLDEVLGGVWMDWTDGVARVAFKEDAELHMAELRALFPYPERLTVVIAEHSLTELIAVQQELVSQLDDLQAEGIDVATSSIDEVAGRVDVRVSVLTDAAATELARRLGADRIRVEQGPLLSTWSRS